ncbi:MAG: thioredoxin domain-containing protein [Hyphomicrobiaceae bacterium]
MRTTLAIVVLTLALVLAGCGADTATLLTGTGPTLDAASVETSATPDKPAFNPFSDQGATDTPLREVIANPTRAEIMQAGPLPEFALGRADAPVTIIKYMSLTCPHCRRFQAEVFPVLKRDYIDKGHVRLILREFPIGKTSGNATIALRCAPMDKYLPLYEKFMTQQATWVSQEVRPDVIFKVAAQVGLSREQFDACLKDQKLIESLKQIKDRGRTLGIIGTPNFFFETRLVKKTIGVKELRELLDPLVAAQVAGKKTP